jgi:hypothetical protein
VYTLTLTHEDRTSLVWIGHRYSHGNDLLSILNKCDYDYAPDQCDVQVYKIPEHLAWELQEKINADDLACIDPRSDLYRKLRTFADSVI